MKLNAYCKNCQTKNRIPSRGVLTRSDLLESVGKEVEFKFIKCETINKIHINLIFATSSNLQVFVSLIVGLIVIAFGVMSDHKNGWSVIWTTGIGGIIISAGLVSNIYSNSRVFNKTLL